jgi:hypothetical protein
MDLVYSMISHRATIYTSSSDGPECLNSSISSTTAGAASDEELVPVDKGTGVFVSRSPSSEAGLLGLELRAQIAS